jgi:hypothetical protein
MERRLKEHSYQFPLQSQLDPAPFLAMAARYRLSGGMTLIAAEKFA